MIIFRFVDMHQIYSLMLNLLEIATFEIFHSSMRKLHIKRNWIEAERKIKIKKKPVRRESFAFSVDGKIMGVFDNSSTNCNAREINEYNYSYKSCVILQFLHHYRFHRGNFF